MPQPRFIPDVWTEAITRNLAEPSVLPSLVPARKRSWWQRFTWRLRDRTLGRVHRYIHRNCSDY